MSKKTKIVERDPKKRVKDFKQVKLGYTEKDVVIESNRCLQCKKPMCIVGCPIGVNIPKFIKYLSENNIKEAEKIIRQKSNFPAVCGRVCPQEKQCEKFCVLSKKHESISIGDLECYVSDNTLNDKTNDCDLEIKKNNIKIAVIGSGPAGLTCAGDLLINGFDVVVYESLHEIGGVLRYGIPEFRLPKKILDLEIKKLKNNGMKVVLNNLIGRTISINELFKEGYKAIFISVGAGLPVFPGIDGENLNHVYSSNEFLVRVNLMFSSYFPNYDTPIYVGKKVVVIGGGNTAIDSARIAIRLGAQNVKIVYRRTEDDMPARIEEKRYAKEEGIEFIYLTKPVKLIGDKNGFVSGIKCVNVEKIYGNTNNYINEICNSEHVIYTDMVIFAIGLHPNPILSSLTKELNINKKGHIIVDNNYMTSIRGVFAGGDIIGGKTVIEAMGMAKKASKFIMKYISDL
jgi:glutamate synthase (NADPH/NADH) small chain